MKIELPKFNCILFLALMIMPAISFAQFDKKKERKSLPQKVTAHVEGVKVVVEYAAPEVRNRKVFGQLVPYGKLWRTGANEATTIEVSGKIAIDGKELDEGKYALFTIPGENEWTVIFNSEYDQWGAYNYDGKKDVLRVMVTPEKSGFHEIMEFEITENGKLYLYWENIRIPMQITTLSQ